MAIALVVVVWLPSAVWLAARIRVFGPYEAHIKAAALLALAMAVLLPCLLLSGGRVPNKQVLWSLPIAGVSILAILAIVSAELPPVTPTTGSAFLLTAWVEELVFRVVVPALFVQVLPRRSATHLSAGFVGIVAAQLLFAISHAPITHAFGASDVVRLFGGGILYSLMLHAAGLGLTSAFHAAFNLGVATGDVIGAPASTIALVTAAATALLWFTQAGRLRANRVSVQVQPHPWRDK